jgi:hypothetical protein
VNETNIPCNIGNEPCNKSDQGNELDMNCKKTELHRQNMKGREMESVREEKTTKQKSPINHSKRPGHEMEKKGKREERMQCHGLVT